MAKIFYRFDEAKQVLNLSDEQLKQLTREGKLREFRDGATIMYKADQVDGLRSEMGLAEPIELGPSDTHGSGGADARSNTAGGSVLSLADTSSKDDTAMDLGLSSANDDSGGIPLAGGSLGGTKVGSPASRTGTGIPMSSTGSGIDLAGETAAGSGGLGGTATGGSLGGTRAGTRSGSGVSVLGFDEGGTADPSAQTVGGSFGGEPSLDAMGSGSGLLDLSQARDDTSLGAPVLDEITGSGRAGTGSMAGLSGSSVGPISNSPLTPAAAAARGGAVPIYVEAPDRFTGFAAGASIAAALLCLIALYAVIAAASNAQPSLLGFLYQGEGAGKHAMPMLYVLGGGLLLAGICGLIGFLTARKR